MKLSTSSRGLKQASEARRVAPLSAWVAAARPATWPAAIVPAPVGTAAAFAEGSFHLAAFICALVVSLLIQIGTNYSNDYFDYRKGADTAQRRGPIRLIQTAQASPRQVLAAALLCFGLAIAIGVYLVFLRGWVILVIGLACVLAGLAYTGGPYPLGYHGLGDLTVFVFFGVLGVTGTYYLHAGTMSPLAWWSSLPVGMLVTAILVVNNIRDIETDRAAGKLTLAVRMGRPVTRVEFVLLLAVAYLVPLGLWLAGPLNWAFWLPWLTLPMAYLAARAVIEHEDGPTLNRTLKLTARLHLAFGLLFAVSLTLIGI